MVSTDRGSLVPEAHLPSQTSEIERVSRIQIRNRRRRYLDLTPAYFSSSDLELGAPLLYDRLVRQFQSSAERAADDSRKGFAGVLQADLCRAEARLAALRRPGTGTALEGARSPASEVVGEERKKEAEVEEEEVAEAEEAEGWEETPQTQPEATARWRLEMARRFVNGRDPDFDYLSVDESEEWDDRGEEERELLERWVDADQGSGWSGKDEKAREGETGVQDF